MKRNYFILLLFFFHNLCYAWPTWMLSKDQQAYNYWKKNDFNNAVRLFKNDSWRAVSAYRLGNFDLAKQILISSHNLNDLYNLGNTYAKIGEYTKAKKLYKTVLSQNPKDQDAQYNYELMNQLIKKQNKQQNKQQNNTKETQNKTQSKNEEQQANKQLLELIPENIRGMLRQQLWRDHILKQRELQDYD